MIRDVLTRDLVVPCLVAANREDVIDAMIDLLCRTGQVADRDLARHDVLANERRSSTGMQHGVAIPHAKTAAVTRLLACVAVTESPIDFDSLDRQACRIFVMTLSPPDQTGPHMRFIAEVGRLLRDRRAREAVLAARSADELLAAFTSG